jgi:hypothetical protein
MFCIELYVNYVLVTCISYVTDYVSILCVFEFFMYILYVAEILIFFIICSKLAIWP